MSLTHFSSLYSMPANNLRQISRSKIGRYWLFLSLGVSFTGKSL
jgi:hypothetical protein